MSIHDRLCGILLAVAYGLDRAKIGFLRLRTGVILLCCLFATYAVYSGWRAGFGIAHGAAILLCLLMATVLLWADRRHYIVFREEPAAPGGAREIDPEERLQLRGSGLFEVSGMSRYLVEVPIFFWTTQLADHIVAAKVRALNILGVGVPSEERGWWYVFIEPRHIVAITPGHLCFGFGFRPAVRVQVEAQKTHQLVYFSCDSAEQRARLLRELGTRAQVTHQGAA